MPIQILMPALSPTMEDGTLAKWLVKEGDQVTAGDVIAEIETDKATMEVEAIDEGRVGRLLIGEGTEHVAVNAPIAILLEEGEDQAILESFTAARAEAAPAATMPEAATAQSTLVPEEALSAAVQSVQNDSTNGEAPRIVASPLARRLAKDNNLDLTKIEGSGPNGRIVKQDIEKILGTGLQTEEEPGEAAPPVDTFRPEEAPSRAEPPRGEPPQVELPRAGKVLPTEEHAEELDRTAAASELGAREPSAPQPSEPVRAMVPTQVVRPLSTAPSGMSDEQILSLYDPGSYEIVPLDNMRKTIAKRLVEAKSTIPHFYLSMDCELEALLHARERMNETAPEEGPNGYRLSVNDFAIKALAMALQQVPEANATWTDQGILRHKRSDIGVAVSVEGGLFTPIIRHAELKSLSEISNEMRDLAGRARKRRLAPHEYQGGTTSISNLGMYGVKKFEAVINPPHATILAIGQGERRPVVKEGAVQAVTMMSVTLSCDHRVVDGALGAALLGAFKQFIEDPVTMLV